MWRPSVFFTKLQPPTPEALTPPLHPQSADGLRGYLCPETAARWDKATASVICIYDITLASWNQVGGT